MKHCGIIAIARAFQGTRTQMRRPKFNNGTSVHGATLSRRHDRPEGGGGDAGGGGGGTCLNAETDPAVATVVGVNIHHQVRRRHTLHSPHLQCIPEQCLNHAPCAALAAGNDARAISLAVLVHSADQQPHGHMIKMDLGICVPPACCILVGDGRAGGQM